METPSSTQLVAAAGGAVVTAARVGRLLGRSGWRIAKQLPGVRAVLDLQHSLIGTPTPEEQRAMLLVQHAANDPDPLRTAMSELLERSAAGDSGRSQEYLFGTIVSQLVPDEARILATLAESGAFAVVDVVAATKQGGSTVLANASTVGHAAGVAVTENVSTYLTRLHGFGLIEFGAERSGLEPQFAWLEDDRAVRLAGASAEKGKQAAATVVRKTATLSALGEQFWAACAPSRSARTRRTG